jgi:putative redox protein
MSKRTAVVRQLKGLTFATKSDSNHWVMMDATEELGGENAGSRPKELVLMALGGCTGSDVVSILAKKRVPLDSLQLNLSANTREQHPQIFTDIHIEYVFRGNGIAPEDVERAIELSTTKYCSVSAMLKPTVTLTHSYRIEPAEGGRNP